MMNMTKSVYNQLFEGDSVKAAEQFPFLNQGAYVKVIDTISRKIGVFPNKDSFYVVTFYPQTKSNYHAIIEETNSLSVLNSVVKREMFGEQYLSEDILSQVKEFLEEHNCMNILD